MLRNALVLVFVDVVSSSIPSTVPLLGTPDRSPSPLMPPLSPT